MGQQGGSAIPRNTLERTDRRVIMKSIIRGHLFRRLILRENYPTQPLIVPPLTIKKNVGIKVTITGSQNGQEQHGRAYHTRELGRGTAPIHTRVGVSGGGRKRYKRIAKELQLITHTHTHTLKSRQELITKGQQMGAFS